MKTPLRQLSVIPLILLVAVPFLFSIFSTISLGIIKIQVAQELESEQLQTITISESNIKWVDQDKELLINGHLFDVKSFKRTDNNFVITGLYDKDEDYLQKHFIKIFHQKQQGNSSARAMLINLIFQPVFSDKNTYYNYGLASVIFRKACCSFIENLATTNGDILIPPPKAGYILKNALPV